MRIYKEGAPDSLEIVQKRQSCSRRGSSVNCSSVWKMVKRCKSVCSRKNEGSVREARVPGRMKVAFEKRVFQKNRFGTGLYRISHFSKFFLFCLIIFMDLL